MSSNLSELLSTSQHTLALPEGNHDISLQALTQTQQLFNKSLSAEASSLPHIHQLLLSILQQPPKLRSQSSSFVPPAATAATDLLPPTPLDALYIEDVDAEQVWEQLELKTKTFVGVLKEFGLLDGVERDDEVVDEGEMDGRGISDSDDDEEDEGSEESLDMDDIDMDMGSEDEDEAELDGELEGGVEFDDDDEDEDGFHDEEDDEEEEDDDDDVSDEEEEERGPRIIDLDAPGSRSSSLSKKFSPLDDPFFNLHDFNAETLAAEALESSSGKLGDDASDSDDEDDDIDNMDFGTDAGVDIWKSVDGGVGDDKDELFDMGGIDLGGKGGDQIKYSDFFLPPKPIKKPSPETAPSGKGKAKYVTSEEGDEMSDEDAEDGEEDSEVEFDDDEAGEDDLMDMDDAEEESSIKKSFKKGLLDDSDDEEEGEQLSAHEKRLATLNAQIHRLEQQNVGKKDWTLIGEASSKNRPLNSLLEEDLDFEAVGKAVPVVTEESVKGIEEMIKKRILDGSFDDVVRRKEMDAKPFLPSRFFELQDSQSSKSLAEIYEDSYTASSSGGGVGSSSGLDDRDGKLKKEHDEIEAEWDAICYKLDALSNANFTPKLPKVQIQTLSNLASTSLETSLPPILSTSTLLAPEEIFTPSASDLLSKTELTPTQKKALRSKEKKKKKKERMQLDKAVDKFANAGSRKKGRKGEKGEKDKALKSLLKNGAKGVTVIGSKADATKQGKKKST